MILYKLNMMKTSKYPASNHVDLCYFRRHKNCGRRKNTNTHPMFSAAGYVYYCLGLEKYSEKVL